MNNAGNVWGYYLRLRLELTVIYSYDRCEASQLWKFLRPWWTLFGSGRIHTYEFHSNIKSILHEDFIRFLCFNLTFCAGQFHCWSQETKQQASRQREDICKQWLVCGKHVTPQKNVCTGTFIRFNFRKSITTSSPFQTELSIFFCINSPLQKYQRNLAPILTKWPSVLGIEFVHRIAQDLGAFDDFDHMEKWRWLKPPFFGVK